METNSKIKQQLILKAREAMKNAYVPYSRFPVGAALLTGKGNIYTGCNIENSSFGATNCAERTAIFKAVSEGEKEFRMLAVVSNNPRYTFPCGICRQVISEFTQDMELIFQNKQGEMLSLSVEELFPYPFGEEDMEITKEEVNID